MMRACNPRKSAPKTDVDVPSYLEKRYRRDCIKGTAISVHLPRLRRLAQGLNLVVEFGVRAGDSTVAWLLGARRVMSWDILSNRSAQELARVVGPDRWIYTIGDSVTARVPPCDLLFVDSQHTLKQCSAELVAHAQKAQCIVLHDTVSFGSIGDDGGPGILGAVHELLSQDSAWSITEHHLDGGGLMVLQRSV